MKKWFMVVGFLFFVISLEAFASNGNPRIPANTPGANNASVFCNARPCQEDDSLSEGSNVGGLYRLKKDENYFIDSGAYPGYIKYGVTSTPVPTNYGFLLLKDDSNRKYAVASFTLGSPVGPADEPIDKFTWYKLGAPLPPTVGSVLVSYDTARISWSLEPDYEYSQIELEVKRKVDGKVIMPANGSSPTILGGSVTSYSFGGLIDGRTLEAATTYEVQLVAKVKKRTLSNGFEYFSSSPTRIEFVTLGFEGRISEGIQTFVFRKPSTGINTFAIFLDVGNASRPVSYETSVPGIYATLDFDGDLGSLKVWELIRAINSKAGRNVVTVFGWWDESAQTHKGLTSIAYNTDGTIDTKTTTAVGDTVENILNAPIITGQPWQASVNTGEVNFVLKGFK